MATTTPSAGTTSLVTGWGFIDNSNTSPNVLQVLHTVRADDTRAFQDSQYYDDSTQVPTYDKDEGVCNGDSGGPLVANGEQYGIVSYGMSRKYLFFPFYSRHGQNSYSFISNA